MKSRTVWKFPLNLGWQAETIVETTRRNRVVHVGRDAAGNPSVWIEINRNEDQDDFTPTRFVCYYTGDEIEEYRLNHAGVLIEGSLVYHVYTDGTVAR